MDIYQILSSKPHNKHYLNRYYKFIMACFTHNVNNNIVKRLRKSPTGTYMESHHICPKSIDLFPEYKRIKDHSWNYIHLTARQHFIAHYLLYKAYGGRQTYAFNAMCNQAKNKNTERSYRINSKIYQNLKNQISNPTHPNRGTSIYQDKDGNKMRVSTQDPRVLSGELTSINAGRIGTMKGKKHTTETIQKLQRPKTAEHIKKNSEAHKGKILSEEHKQSISNTLKGRVPWNKGKIKALEF